MKINIFLPGLPITPGGGYKIMYEYANQFVKLGHDVVIYNVITNSIFEYPHPHWLRYLYYSYKYPHFRPSWYPLLPQIVCRNIPRLHNKFVRNADVAFSTNFALTFELTKLSKNKGAKYNLIQGYETWIPNSDNNLHASYHLPLYHISIADYLADIVEKETNNRPPIVYNGIDNNVFKLQIPIEQKNPFSVSMLYSEELHKGSLIGLEALRMCKKEIPNLHVELFSVYEKPNHITEDWINFTRKPSNLAELYNLTAIFLSPSNTEGWGLPPTEAMFCGCALVCTNIGGHAAYAKNNETALLVSPQKAEDIAEKLLILLKDNNRRVEIAKKGNVFIQQFSWDTAVHKMLTIFEQNGNN